jgi:hypothetical protein
MPCARARNRAAILSACALGFVAFMLASAPSRGQSSDLSPDLEQIRLGLEKYRDPVVAVRDGYFSTLGCIEYPRPGGHGQVGYRPGAMGIHFLNPALVGPTPDPKRPAILLYEPDAQGRLTLVGAEWFVPLATGVPNRPQLFGRPFDGPMEGHEPLLPETLHHYDLHVWLWKPNPYGVFSPTHPQVKCSGYHYTITEDAPRVVPHPRP